MIPQLQMLEQQQQHQAEMYQKSKSLGPAQIFMRDTKGKPHAIFNIHGNDRATKSGI